MILDELHKALLNHPNQTGLIIEWENGLTVEGHIDTLYESDNGLDPDEAGFKEYYACSFEVRKVLSPPRQIESSATYKWLQQNRSNLIEVAIEGDPPSEVRLFDGTVIWQRGA